MQCFDYEVFLKDHQLEHYTYEYYGKCYVMVLILIFVELIRSARVIVLLSHALLDVCGKIAIDLLWLSFLFGSKRIGGSCFGSIFQIIGRFHN